MFFVWCVCVLVCVCVCARAFLCSVVLVQSKDLHGDVDSAVSDDSVAIPPGWEQVLRESRLWRQILWDSHGDGN